MTTQPLFTAPELDSHEIAVLKRIASLEKQLAFGISPKRWYGLLRRNALARAVRASNSIEGYVISSDDAVAAVEGEEPLDPKSENWFANLGYQRALTMVLQKAESPYFEYSAELLNSLHFMMLDYDLTKSPGNWRARPIFVSDSETGEIVYEGAEADLVPDLMSSLVEELNSEGDFPATIQAAMAHLNLVMIHPFSDGNGRMGRCLQTLVLVRAGTINPNFASIEEYLGRNTSEYYRVLSEVGGASWRPHGNTRSWIRFNLTAHFRQATTLLRRSNYYQQLFDLLEELLAQKGLPQRAVYALADAALGAKVRNATYRKLADISMRPSGRDLKSLVDAGLLTPKSQKRGRFYQASTELLKLTTKIPRPKRVDDPFEALEEKPPRPGMENTILED